MAKFDEMEMLGESPFIQKSLRFRDEFEEGIQEEDQLEAASSWELAFERGERMASEEYLGRGDDDY